ncbi:ABC transporter permease [Alkalicoccobacillus murimartini]|uniref:NitT/TauT family transport system permease protein n=1 Tax=Alkalicoccobacillus murimartini TaxID=171685 RepID=A0ABT9YI28_9BACI|nr:ABC transporter permease [Alkalicoccobacillus murimartini]MDQ0207356.1 NitT/TauT family transport system permease protein [Alkalicoccobacillus murimartini]
MAEHIKTVDTVAVPSNKPSKAKSKKRRAWASIEKEPKEWTLQVGRLGVFALFITLWELLARFEIINSFFWSMPSEILQTWLIIAADGSVWYDTFYTFQSTIYGFLIGTVGGAAIGLSFWWSKYYAKVTEPFLIIFEAMPKLALAPIVVLIFGIGLSSKVAMAIAITIIITTLTTYNGMKQVDRDLVRMIFALGASRWQVFTKVVVPWTMPAIISALRINIGLALTGAIVGEYIGSSNGLGRMIFYAGQTYEISLIWAGIFNLSLLSVLLYLIISWLEKRLLQGVLHK